MTVFRQIKVIFQFWQSKKTALILVKSRSARPHCEEDGGAKHNAITSDTSVFAVKNGYIFLFDS